MLVISADLENISSRASPLEVVVGAADVVVVGAAEVDVVGVEAAVVVVGAAVVVVGAAEVVALVVVATVEVGGVELVAVVLSSPPPPQPMKSMETRIKVSDNPSIFFISPPYPPIYKF
jgi:hypothetical protein